MQPKDLALALAASSLLLLSLGAATGAAAFYASSVVIAAALAADGCRYLALRYGLGRGLRVTRRLSASDMLLGSPLTIAYDFEYRGRRRGSLPCRQPAGPRLEVKAPSALVDLRPGRQTIELVATPTGRGRHTIEGLVLEPESACFRGRLTACGSGEVNVYPAVDVRPGRMRGRGVPGSVVGNEAAREGAGVDFSHIRAYVPGDSVRNVDWARSARQGELVVKSFEDVRSRPLFVLIDVDSSMETGEAKTELESAVELATLLAGRVLLANERVGIACFSRSDVTAYLPLAAGKPQMARARQLLAAVGAARDTAEPRPGAPLLQEAIAAQKAFCVGGAGLEAFGSVLGEAIRQFDVNIREDGFVRAILKASRASAVPCHFVVATNLSMGASSLLNGARIARYYGHDVTVALAPRVWYEPREGLDAEGCFRRYREAVESVQCLRSYRIEVLELSPATRPEEALLAGRARTRRSAGRVG